MKKLKQLAAFFCILVCLTGCIEPAPAAYPAIKPMDTTGITLDSGSYNGIKVSFPAEQWIFGDSLGKLTLYYADALDSDQVCNINVQCTVEAAGPLTESDMEQLMDEMAAYEGYITVDDCEICTLNDASVILMNSTVQFTDAYIDEMIELGGFTEEQLEALGGREVLLAIPPTTQVSLYAVVDGYLYVYVGTYYTGEQRQAVLDCITVLVANTEQE